VWAAPHGAASRISLDFPTKVPIFLSSSVSVDAAAQAGPMCVIATLGAGIAASGSLISTGQPSWQHDVSSALKRDSRSPASKYLQLATVTPAGLPAVRTVVFRGWLWSTCTMMMITDARSGKLLDIAAQPRCEIAWYLEKTREQFRIQGAMRAVYSDEANVKLSTARQTVWHNLSDEARAQFDDPLPGAPIGDLNAGAAAREGDGTDPPAVPPISSNFVLMLLRPDAVDQLRLSRPQHRWVHRLEPGPGMPGLEPAGETAAADDAKASAAWSVVEVNP